MSNPTSANSRYCLRCEKAKKTCICAFIKPISCSVPLIILQHPSEAKKAIGTARIAHLTLPLCDIYVGENFTEHKALNERIQDDPYHYLLLYPHEKAISISGLLKTRAQDKNKFGLIVIDGTWKKAFKIWSLSTNLHALPKVTLDEVITSDYKIRQSSKKAGVSTVEAIYHALSSLNEHKKDYGSLLTAFHQMIQSQIKHIPAKLYQAHYTQHK